MTRLLFPVLAALALAACAPQGPAPRAPADLAPAPPGAPPGTCWGKEVAPAVIETVTEQIEIAPPSYGPDGRMTAPARYATETRQVIVNERQVLWIETPCPDVMTPEFISSVQRALAVRGEYRGPVTGTLDPATRDAIRRHQVPLGIDSDTLALSTARSLGLVAVPRPE
jgi:hypothetical protein